MVPRMLPPVLPHVSRLLEVQLGLYLLLVLRQRKSVAQVVLQVLAVVVPMAVEAVVLVGLVLMVMAVLLVAVVVLEAMMAVLTLVVLVAVLVLVLVVLVTPLVVRKSILIHLCGDAHGTGRQTAARTSDVAASVASIVQADKSISCSALKSIALEKLQEVPSQAMLRRAKSMALRGRDGKFAPGEDLQLLPSFLESIEEADTDSKAVLWTGDDQAYLGWFIAPGCSVRSLHTNRLRALFTADAAHCRGPEAGLLVGFHAFGPADELITLACAHMLGESEATWSWFFTNLCLAFHGLEELVSHIITDGDKGLQNAVRNCLPNAYHASCAFHRSQKLSDQTTTRPLFQKMAGSYTLEQYTTAREELERRASPASVATIDNVPPNAYCLAHMPVDVEDAQRHWRNCKLAVCEFSALHYGQLAPFDPTLLRVSGNHYPSPIGKTTSQGAESYAAKMEKNHARDCSAFQLASVAFHDILQVHATLRELYSVRKGKGYHLSTYAADYMERRNADLGNLQIASLDIDNAVPNNTRYVGSVKSKLTVGLAFAVTLIPGELRSTCECRTPSVRGLPCKHAVKLALPSKVDADNLVNPCFTVEAGCVAFAGPAQTIPVGTSDLEPANEALVPPLNHPKRGRPSTKRKRGKLEPASNGKKPRMRRIFCCSLCGQEGHTKKKCRE